MQTAAKRVSEYWMRGCARGRGPPKELMGLWFGGKPETDRHLRDNFLGDVEAAARGDYDALAETDEGLVAQLVLLDQFPRNIYRDTPQMYAADPKAREVARRAVAERRDERMGVVERMFVYLPFEHSEDVADQRESVRLFSAMLEGANGEERGFCEALLKFAKDHHDDVAKYGRFPHRNALLGRENTPAEEEYLKAGGGYAPKQQGAGEGAAK